MAGRGHSGSSGKTANLVYIDERSVKNLQAAAAAIRAKADPKDRKHYMAKMNAEIREAADPMKRDIERAARDLKFRRTSKQGQSRARREGRTLKSGKFKAGRGLRDGIAFGIRTQINTGRTAAGVRIRLASKDPVINRLGKVINSRGKIRHPLFGDRDHWHDTQTTNGRGWFYNAAYPHRKIVGKRVERVLDKWVRDLATSIEKAA